MTTQPLQSSPILISDFDGTMARRDFYDLVRSEILPPETPDFWGRYLAGKMTHFEALRQIFLRIGVPEADLLALVQRMELDPELPRAVARLQAAGWQVVVASAGCAWYIERLLADAGVAVTVHANPGSYDPAQGLQMRLPENSAYFSPETGIDKARLLRDAVATHDVVAFAGDGPPDLPAALQVPPTRRFARGWLADALRERGESFHPFTGWAEIAEILTTSPASPHDNNG